MSNVFQKLHLKDCGPFKDTQFTFEKGLSVVYGLNRSGGKFSTNANGAGKSFLLSQLSEILFEQPVIGERQDKVKTGQRTLSLSVGGKPWVIRRQESKIEIKVEGRLKKFRTPTIAREWLKRNLPWTPEEFGTFIYLDSRVPHPLVMGSSVERKRFFTSFFGLDTIDSERKLFLASLAEISKTKAAYDELYAEYKRSTADLLDREANDVLGLRIDKGERALANLQAKNLALQEVSRLVSFATASRDQILELRKACHNEDLTEESFQECLTDAKWNLKHNSENLESALEWEAYNRDNKAYREAIENLTPIGRKLLANKAKAKTGSEHYVRSVSVERQVREEADELEHAAASRPNRVEQPEEAEIDLQVLKKAYAHQLDHAEKFGEGKCETCGQAVEIKDPKVIQKRLQIVQGKLNKWAAYNSYKEELKVYKRAKARFDELNEKGSQLLAQVAKFKPYHVAHKELQALPDKPQPFEGKKVESKVMQRMVNEDRARLQLLAFCRPHLETIIEIQKLTNAQIDEASKAPAVQQKINEVQDKLAALKAQHGMQATLRIKARHTKARLTQMKEEIKHEPALKILLQAYSDKAMKRMAIQAISNRLMETVNKYARHVFPEDYQFEFRWDTSQLQLIVNRKYGKKVQPSDVRKLSGAESKLFTIVLILALLSFVPASKRSSMIVLDEPTANFSEETTLAFQELLPILNKMIPTIVVITPKSKEVYEGASNYTVVKSQGVSTIVKGHPSTIKESYDSSPSVRGEHSKSNTGQRGSAKPQGKPLRGGQQRA